jgi:hypothetical protein
MGATSTGRARVIERDGRRWLQQYRRRPNGKAYEYDWVTLNQSNRFLADTQASQLLHPSE